jgi:hypothetical protein
VSTMVEGGRDWISPYEHDQNVARKVVKFVIGNVR